MFSFEGFVRINTFLQGIYRLAYLNLLWLAGTLLGLVLFGVGPASYALAAYIDRWFRRGENPPVTKTFIADFRAHYWHAAGIGWILTAAAAVIVTNVFSAQDWFVQFANVAALVVLTIIAAYVFPVMAATDVRGIPRQIAAALLLGIGSLHWTIIAAAVAAGALWLVTTFALPLLLFFGIAIPAAAVGFVTRIVFGRLTSDDTPTSPPGAREPSLSLSHLARGTSE